MNYIEKVIFRDGLFFLVLKNGSEIGGVIQASVSSSSDDFAMISCLIECSDDVIDSLNKARQECAEWAVRP